MRSEKGIALLRFLEGSATLRQKRVTSYDGPRDKVLWLGRIPKDRPECRSVFISDDPSKSPEIWLEIRKKQKPVRPPIPDLVADWVRPEDLDNAGQEPELLTEITVPIEVRVPDPNGVSNKPETTLEKIPEQRRLQDYSEVGDVWLDYLVDKWEPWSKRMLLWLEIQEIYEPVDFMRRHLEASEEHYELFLAIGLLQMRDSSGKTIKRHLLTAPAEIVLEASRGILRVVPAASFECFRVELDMLDTRDQPHLNKAELEKHLAELDINVWDTEKVGQILYEIANQIKADAQVEDKKLMPAGQVDETLRVTYAPGLVLRERPPTAYKKMVSRLLNGLEDKPAETTQPWERFLDEGESSGDITDSMLHQDSNGTRLGDLPDRPLFPLATNKEQLEILNRIRAQPYILVKGPPGTGKSQTISNLICHLLAYGERVLVTAYAPKALTVLRGLLPSDVRDLCVTALGSSREDLRILEEGVRGIIRRQNELRGTNWDQDRIEILEGELQEMQGELTKTERKLLECREAETYPHTLKGGYKGTAAWIAKQIEKERNKFVWAPQILHDETPFPLKPEDVRFLAKVHADLTEDFVRELRQDTGDFLLPDAGEFRQQVTDLKAAEKSAESAKKSAPEEKLECLRNCNLNDLDKTVSLLRTLDQRASSASHVLGDIAEEILKGLLVGYFERWTRIAADATLLLNTAYTLREEVGTTQFELPSDVEHGSFLSDVERRLEHFDNGGRRGIGIFTTRVVKETRYIEERCKVDGRPPRDIRLLAKLEAYLQLSKLVKDFANLWPTPLPVEEYEDPIHSTIAAIDLLEELYKLLKLSDELGSDSLPCIPITDRTSLNRANEREEWLKAIEAETAIRHERRLKRSLEELLQTIQLSLDRGSAHPCLNQLSDAIERRNSAEWQLAWDIRENLQAERKRLGHYEELIDTLDQSWPGFRKVIDDSGNDPEWSARLLNLENAWWWSSASGWIQRISDLNTHRNLNKSIHRLQSKIEKKIGELVALRAWCFFFERLDDITIQNLKAWTTAIKRIGVGKGKYAYRHRRSARSYIRKCIPKIPAWVMPLHKLWDTVDAKPGLFDTVIVDEASQAGIESLALFLLAKRIIVVGDEKQNSPEAVGVREDDIARLANEHLAEFRFRDEFRPDTSLFDHAERSFGHVISLREHFRCVPEIIRFSNDLCYRDAPLIPLRQAPPNRLPPLIKKYVEEGACEGQNQYILNRAEAVAVVDGIKSCIENRAYEEKTMGVVVMQGRAQADLIANMLAKELDPKDIEARRLICGVPATFQGDQRDVVFLSLVMAPNVHYRALTKLTDERRFNVAMSRARDQVWLFHSIQQHDLSPECLRRKLISFFEHDFDGDPLLEQLDRLERAVREAKRLPGEQPEPYESWFEVDVALELLRRRYKIRPQYEVAGKRIDIVVEGVGNFLAVEVDGDTWHGPEDYEKDMARQRELERGAGLIFVRVPEFEFYANRNSAVEQIVSACEELDIQPVDKITEVQEQEHTPRVDVDADRRIENLKEFLRSDHIPGAENYEAEDIENAEYGPFTGYGTESAFPDPRLASSANVRVALRQIIETDGPIIRASVYRLYVKGCPDVQRAGVAVRRSLNRALGNMLRSGDIVQENEFIDRSPEGLVIRLVDNPKVRERSAGGRDLLEIPPSELSLLLHRIRPTADNCENDNEILLRRLLKHYGYNRLTPVRRKYLNKILELGKNTLRD